MRIICVSRGTLAGGSELAEKLAAKLGCDCLAREDLTDAATRAGIPVGKLEMAVVSKRPLGERLALEKERFKAFLTATLCEKAAKGSFVYHGRTGHLVLPGVSNVMRVRVIQDPEQRIASVMERLNLSREKARDYIEAVDDDRRRWVRSLYNVDWLDPAQYDAVVNLSHLSVGNASTALVAMAQLPEFQLTPATLAVIEDLLLASRCRLAIGADQRTREMDVQVRAKSGRVSVTYLPRQERTAGFIPEILRQVDGVREIVCTMATTNLLWIQERFDPNSEALRQVLDIAGKWNAAVELVQLGGEGAAESEQRPTAPEPSASAATAAEDGGILDDTVVQEEDLLEDPGLRETHEALISAGRAGGHRRASDAKELLANLDKTIPYSLVVVGEVFLSRSESARKRLARELVGYLSEKLRVPVIGAEDLKAQYLFGPAQWLRLLGFGAAAAALFLLVLTNQEQVLEFLGRGGAANRMLSTALILTFVPIFAYIYGNFGRYLLRLFRFE